MKFSNYINEPTNEQIMVNEGKAILLPSDMIPKKTVKGYKLFIKKGNNLYPLFVNANDNIPIGKWVSAEFGPAHKDGGVKSKLGKLAFRPGFHSGNMPLATHIGGKSSSKSKAPDYRPDNQVWAEVLIPADVNWQEEANKRATLNKKGNPIARTAHITDQLPTGGHYSYKTNSNMTGSWLISGAIKITKILSDDQVKKINDKFGVSDLPRLKDL